MYIFNAVKTTAHLTRFACCKFAVMSSKAIGEPPFAMGISVFFAIKDALDAARRERGVGEFILMHPATSERIRMAVGDDIAMESGGGPEFQAKGSY